MKRGSLIFLVFFVGCDASFQSGKTQCSDKGECPSGYLCNAAFLCIAVSGVGGSGGGASGATGVAGATGSPGGIGVAGATGSPGGIGVAGATGGPGGIGVAGATGGPGGIGGIAGAGGSLGGAGSSGSTSACPLADYPEAGGTCNVLPACGCPTGQVCHAASESIGLACTADIGPGNGADCSSAKVCASGFGCFAGICSKYCKFDSDCPEVDMTQGCLQIYWPNGDYMTGVSVCAEICDPVSPQNPKSPLQSCPAGFGCSADQNGDSYCQKQAGTGVADSSCPSGFDSECAPGYFCDYSGNTCVKYCFVDGNNCPLGTTCYAFSPSYYAGFLSEVGYCY